MFRYPPRIGPLAPDQGERAASQCTEPGERDRDDTERGTRFRRAEQRAGSVTRGRIG
jgi:hypothetical protein